MTCPDCRGDGHYTVTTRQHHSGEKEVRCERCEGTGQIQMEDDDDDVVGVPI